MNSFKKNSFNMKQKKIIFFILHFDRKQVRSLVETFWQLHQICNINWRGKKSMKNIFCGNPANFSNQFRTLIKKVRNFQKFLRKICQTPFYVSRWTFGRKWLFFENLMTIFFDLQLWAKNFRTSTKTFQQSCKNCIPCFRKTSLNYSHFWQE